MAYRWSGVNYLSQRSKRSLTQSVCMPDFCALSLGILQVWRSRALSRWLRADEMEGLKERSGEETLAEEKFFHVEWDESIHPFSLMRIDAMTSSQPQERRKNSFWTPAICRVKNPGLFFCRTELKPVLWPSVRHTLIGIIEAFVQVVQCYQEQFNNPLLN